MIGDANGEALLLEPTKCAEWRWIGQLEFPQALFAPTAAFFFN